MPTQDVFPIKILQESCERTVCYTLLIMHTKTHEDLENELKIARSKVKIGGIYSHFKNSNNHYEVLDLAFQEATDNLCVIYRTLYGKKITFVRDLDNWLDGPIVNGKKVKRFTLLKKS